jgi:Thiamine pyrophosphate enzyme, central domain
MPGDEVITVGALLRAAAPGADVGAVAGLFDSYPVPAGLVHTLRLAPRTERSDPTVEVPAGRVVVLAGPGVVGTGNIDGLRAFATAANVPVANTWGAKGVFPWDDPHHMGTCGLQARDFELLGFAEYDAIVATGIDPAESAPEQFALARVVEIPARELGRLAHHVEAATEAIRPNDLYARLSKVAQPGYADDRVPLHPARAVADVRAVLPSGGVVTAEPGPAGVWVARTFPTIEPGTVLVPASAKRGIAAALALAAALHGVPAIGVTTEPLDPTTLAVLKLATELGAALLVDVWGAGGPVRRAEDHLGHLQAAANEPGVTTVDVPVDGSLMRKLVDAAGRVVAWGGLPVREVVQPGRADASMPRRSDSAE